ASTHAVGVDTVLEPHNGTNRWLIRLGLRLRDHLSQHAGDLDVSDISDIIEGAHLEETPAQHLQPAQAIVDGGGEHLVCGPVREGHDVANLRAVNVHLLVALRGGVLELRNNVLVQTQFRRCDQPSSAVLTAHGVSLAPTSEVVALLHGHVGPVPVCTLPTILVHPVHTVTRLELVLRLLHGLDVVLRYGCADLEVGGVVSDPVLATPLNPELISDLIQQGHDSARLDVARGAVSQDSNPLALGVLRHVSSCVVVGLLANTTHATSAARAMQALRTC